MYETSFASAWSSFCLDDVNQLIPRTPSFSWMLPHRGANQRFYPRQVNALLNREPRKANRLPQLQCAAGPLSLFRVSIENDLEVGDEFLDRVVVFGGKFDEWVLVGKSR